MTLPEAGSSCCRRTQDDAEVSKTSWGSPEGTVSSLRRQDSKTDARATSMLELCAANAFTVHSIYKYWLMPACSFRIHLFFVMNATHNCCTMKLLYYCIPYPVVFIVIQGNLARTKVTLGTIHLRSRHVLGGEGCPHVPMVKMSQYIRIKNPLHKHFAGMPMIGG